MPKADKVSLLQDIFDNIRSPSAVKEWKACDKEKLNKLMMSEIELAITAYGRKQGLMKQQVMATGVDLSDNDWKQLEELWKRKRGNSD